VEVRTAREGVTAGTARKYLSAQSPVALPRRVSNGQPRRGAVDEVAPVIDAILRSWIPVKGAEIH